MPSGGFRKAFEKMKDSVFPLSGNQPFPGMGMKKRRNRKGTEERIIGKGNTKGKGDA